MDSESEKNDVITRIERIENAVFAGDSDVGIAIIGLWTVLDTFMITVGDHAHDMAISYEKLMQEIGVLVTRLGVEENKLEETENETEKQPLRLVPDPDEE